MDTAERLLALLALLQRRMHWAADELAERLGVTTRTVRRDITRLRTYGYPVEAFAGHGGGYQLGRGSQLPPLLLDDDETLAVALGLDLVAYAAIDDLDDAAMAALGKIHQLIPTRLRARLDDLDAISFIALDRGGAVSDRRHFTTVARAASTRTTIAFDYIDHHGAASHRTVEPTRLVHSAGEWYVVAFDLDRLDWRTFRLDRVQRLELGSARFANRPGPEPEELVSRRLPDDVFEFHASIAVDAPVDEVRARLQRVASVDDRGPGTLVQMSTDDLEWLAGFLMALPWSFEVLEPRQLRRIVERRARAVASRHRSIASSEQLPSPGPNRPPRGQ
jgi:predicted DNA-binding transcriptional regulator YafY